MKLEWYVYDFKSKIRQIYKKIMHKHMQSMKYAGKSVLSEDEGSKYLQEMIESGKPFAAARYGYVELETMAAVYKMMESGSHKQLDAVINKGDIFNNAGFFPCDKEKVIEFGNLMQKYSAQVDMVGVWYIPYEEYFIKNIAKSAELTLLRTYEPWNEREPWTHVLKGKKVLVIHPFEKSIQKQYQHREKLFGNTDLLPEFELITYRAVQTIAGNTDSRFLTWFDALEKMYQDIMKLDFDIAILGCGAYGFPLACKLKQAGKQAVHIGGATQLLFGIKGGRWDNHPVVSNLYNEYWVRPDVSEVPQNAQRVENKCYW